MHKCLFYKLGESQSLKCLLLAEGSKGREIFIVRNVSHTFKKSTFLTVSVTRILFSSYLMLHCICISMNVSHKLTSFCQKDLSFLSIPMTTFKLLGNFLLVPLGVTLDDIMGPGFKDSDFSCDI